MGISRDPAGHRTCISTATSNQCGTGDSTRVVFTIDALGRHADQKIGTAATTTYAYLGTSDTVSSTAVGGTLTAYSAIDAIGDRLTTGTPSAFGYLVPDLHGNVVGVTSSTGAWSSAYRYDAFGETVDSCSGSLDHEPLALALPGPDPRVRLWRDRPIRLLRPLV